MYRGVPYCFHLDIPYQKGVPMGFFISNYNFMFSFTTIRYTIICLYR
jgi:hypothetical protein